MTPRSNPVQGWHLLNRVRTRFAPAVAAMDRLNRTWRCNTVSFASKFKLYESLVTSILHYVCETWTLLAEIGKKNFFKKNQALETKCVGKLSRISYLEHKTNGWVWSKIYFLVASQESLLATAKRRRDGNLHGSGMPHATTAFPGNAR